MFRGKKSCVGSTNNEAKYPLITTRYLPSSSSKRDNFERLLRFCCTSDEHSIAVWKNFLQRPIESIQKILIRVRQRGFYACIVDVEGARIEPHAAGDRVRGGKRERACARFGQRAGRSLR